MTATAAPKAKPSKPKKASEKIMPKSTESAIQLCQSILTDLARTNLEETIETAKAVIKSGDVRAAVELQNDFLRSAFKRNMDAARELNEITVTAYKEAMAPYTSKFTEAFEKMVAA